MRRGPRKTNKGAPFEREMAERLSRWWTDGHRSDIFWRTANSGGRATVRRRKALTTVNQAGDLGAIDASGQALLDLVVVELKRGYSRRSIADALDRGEDDKTSLYEGWLEKLITTQRACGVFSWLLIARRDRHEAFVFLPIDLLHELKRYGASIGNHTYPILTLELKLMVGEVKLIGMTLEGFFDTVRPKHVVRLAEELKREREQLGLPARGKDHSGDA